MDTRLKQIGLAAGLTAGLAVAGILFFLDPAHVTIYPVCMFHQITGLDCPGCGGLRAMHQLLHGHLAVALHFNAFLVLSLPGLAWLGVRLIRREIQGGPAPAFRPVWLWLWLTAWMVFGVLRNLDLWRPLH